MTELTIKIAEREMTQNQITALLDYVKVGEKLRIYCFFKEGDVGIVTSKEPDLGPLRRITRVNLENGMSLQRKQRTEDDFTNWVYNSVVVFAVTIEK